MLHSRQHRKKRGVDPMGACQRNRARIRASSWTTNHIRMEYESTTFRDHESSPSRKESEVNSWCKSASHLSFLGGKRTKTKTSSQKEEKFSRAGNGKSGAYMISSSNSLYSRCLQIAFQLELKWNLNRIPLLVISCNVEAQTKTEKSLQSKSVARALTSYLFQELIQRRK